MAHSIAPLVEFLADIVVPASRSTVTINPDHNTQLYGEKSKKQLSRKHVASKLPTLSRRKFARLCLNKMKSYELKYHEVLKLHRIWKGYMREHLGLESGQRAPAVYEPGYEEFSRLLSKADLHGAKLTVIESRCKHYMGITGIVIMETKNIVKLLNHENKLRTVPKSQCIFSMQFHNLEFYLFGNSMTMRPAERTVKKIKTCIEPLMADRPEYRINNRNLLC